MSAKHTPGPWIAVGRWVEHPSDRRADICNCDPASMDQDGRSDAEICANARLIAAWDAARDAAWAAARAAARDAARDAAWAAALLQSLLLEILGAALWAAAMKPTHQPQPTAGEPEMSRSKPPRRRHVTVPMPPPGMRPTMRQDQRVKLDLIVHQTLDSILSGKASAGELMDWAEACLTWSRAAEITGAGIAEMQAAMRLAGNLVARCRETGAIGPADEAERRMLQLSAGWMADLAEAVDEATAVRAALWSTAVQDYLRAHPDAGIDAAMQSASAKTENGISRYVKARAWARATA